MESQLISSGPTCRRGVVFTEQGPLPRPPGPHAGQVQSAVEIAIHANTNFREHHRATATGGEQGVRTHQWAPVRRMKPEHL